MKINSDVLIVTGTLIVVYVLVVHEIENCFGMIVRSVLGLFGYMFIMCWVLYASIKLKDWVFNKKK